MEHPVGYVIKEVQAALRARMDEAVKACGLTVPQYVALYTLRQNPGLSNAELARRCFVTPQTMIRVVANLESSGLIARTPHASHGRILHTTLTAQGRKLIASCHQRAMGVEERMLQSFTPEDKERLRGLLRRCIQSLAE